MRNIYIIYILHLYNIHIICIHALNFILDYSGHVFYLTCTKTIFSLSALSKFLLVAGSMMLLGLNDLPQRKPLLSPAQLEKLVTKADRERAELQADTYRRGFLTNLQCCKLWNNLVRDDGLTDVLYVSKIKVREGDCSNFFISYCNIIFPVLFLLLLMKVRFYW